MGSLPHQLSNFKNNFEVKKILERLEHIKFAIDQASIVAVTDPSGEIIYVNDQFCEISKYSKEELLGKDHRVINSGFHPKSFFKSMWDTIQSGEVWKGEIRNRAKDGTFYWVHSTIIPFTNQDGEIEQYISIRNDITTKKMYEQQIEYMAYRDELTDLPNRSKFNKSLAEKIITIDQYPNGLSVMFLDLDRFKCINDIKGHTFGDYVLKTIAVLMLEQLDEKAEMYRLGGDEFTIIYESSSVVEIKRLANRLLTIFDSPISIKKEDYYLSLSIGVGVYPFHGKDKEILVKNSDIAMYRAKELGGNRVEFFSDNLLVEMNNEMLLEWDLRKAIELEEFTVVYQPKVNLSSKKITGLEALVRWEHPKKGLISPAKFIPAAERTGMIVQISQIVLRKVCEDFSNWLRDGLSPVLVAINFSPVLFNDTYFSEYVKQTLKEFNINPNYIEIEITESVMIKQDLAYKILNDLKSYGLTISLDDFGTGFSSLSLLNRFPIDTLKIDRSFIIELDKSPENGSLVKTIIDIGQNLNLNVIAEGIETIEQMNFLHNNKCSEGQGYLFSPPVTCDIIEDMLKESITKTFLV